MKTIEIIVDPRGAVRVQTKGYAGGECRTASAEIEKALGVPTAEQLTAEFYQGASVAEQQERQRQ